MKIVQRRSGWHGEHPKTYPLALLFFRLRLVSEMRMGRHNSTEQRRARRRVQGWRDGWLWQVRTSAAERCILGICTATAPAISASSWEALRTGLEYLYLHRANATSESGPGTSSTATASTNFKAAPHTRCVVAAAALNNILFANYISLLFAFWICCSCS